MERLGRGAILLLTIAVVSPLQLQARQVGIPGSRPGQVNSARAAYYATVLLEIDRTLSPWQDAWGGDDLDRLVAQYAESGTLVVGSSAVARGQEAIRALLGPHLAEFTTVLAVIKDFDTSDQLTLTAGPLYLTRREGKGGDINLEGRHFTVLIRAGRRWRIRSQVLFLEETPER